MSEVSGSANGTGVIQGELLNALIGKVVDQDASLKEIADQTRKIVVSQEVTKDLHERIAVQEKRIEEFIQQQQGVIEEIRQVAGKIGSLPEKFDTLEQALINFGRLFEKPLDKTVRYRHYVGWPVVVIFALTLIAAGGVAFGVRQWQFMDGYKAAEIKWRYVRLSTDTTVSRVADRAEKRSLEEPGVLAQDVQQEEKRRDEVTRNIIREQTARKKIEELQQQKGLR